ncbi:MAG: hypothetical protein DPW18_08330 [Chloroflexi bacterium]|nr:hypothetical protein [Chloroflexota bacterium]MDL1942860.1 DUF4349 domain-containing protein [Chloroflexi bacterium CFX2]
MKRILPFGIVLIAALILTACGGSRAATEAPAMLEEYDYAGAPEAMPTYKPAAQEAPGSGGGGDARAASVERIVIQNADLSIVVADVEARMNEIQEMAQKMGGFVVSSSLYQSYTSDYTPVPEAAVTIRVPSERLDEALDKIKADVVEVQNETRSGQDVTAEYVDLKSRLKNYEAAERELTELMENAQNTDEVVNIFNQLMYYREQIELVKGQIQYYEEAAALSAISIRIIAEETVQPIEIGGWEPQGVARDAIQDLIYFWQGFVDFVIRFTLYTLPVLVTVGIPLYLVFLGARAVFRRMRGKKKAEPQVEEVKK